MGGDDFSDYNVVIVDEMNFPAWWARHLPRNDKSHNKMCVDIERTIVTPKQFGEVKVYWGIRPSDTDHAELTMAQGTLTLISDDDLDSLSLINNLSRRQFRESIEPDQDRSFQLSTYHRLHEAGGVYHALLPSLFVPTKVIEGTKTKAVNVKKIDQRIAITWIFNGDLEVHLRISETTEKQFRLLKAEDFISPPQTTNTSTRVRDIAWDAAKLPTNPDAWKTLLDIIQTVFK